MKTVLLTLILIFCASLSSVLASSNFVANDTRYDVRYFTNNKKLPDNSYQALLRESSPWKVFVSDHPTWSVLFNEENQKPQIAYGKGIPVAGATPQDRSMNFINTYLLGYKIPLADISIKSITTNARKFDFVNYFQTYKGLPVIDSRIKIKMTKSGEVLYFKTDVFSDINIGITSTISEADAIQYAAAGFSEHVTGHYAAQGLKILPVPGYRKYEYHLVYEVFVQTYDDINHVPANYYTLVDANDGKILSRKNLVDHFAPEPQSNVTATGTLYTTNPYDPTQVKGLPHMKITSGTDYYTDAQGVAAGVPTGNATLKMEGKWCDVMTGTTTPQMTSNITGNPTISFDANSTDRERTAFYHINIIHDFVKAQPQLTGFTAMDTPMNTIVDVSGSCNAFYNGSVNFYANGGGCNATALINDVMYHEYGHGLNYDVYSFYGQTFGNGAMGEGYGDIWAVSISNSPVIGKGFYTANQNGIRRYDPPNRKVYPQDLVGEVHADGEIIAGAWWEVNLNMNSLSFMSSLFIDCFPGGATGPDGSEGTVFMDVLVDALQADDNDNNICNGTPNSSAILPAFSAHGITLYTNITLTHTPVLTSAPNTAITITANVSATSSGPCTFSGGQLFWRNFNAQVWNVTPMTYSNPTLTGTIPAQQAGDLVQYYIEAGGNITPTGANLTPGNIPFYILVGFTPNTSLHSDMGDGQDFGTWTPSSLGNSSGTWIIAAPIASGSVQPGTQVSSGGTKCAVTGNANSASDPIGTADIDGGTTRIESPSFSLSTFTNPAITYYRSYSDVGGSNPGTDPWVAEISNDNGTTWTKIEHTYYSDFDWRRFAFRVLDYTSLSAQMKMRFTASDSTIAALPSNGQSVSEAALDEFQVWDGPMSTTGISAAEAISGLYLFPNPASESFNVSFITEKNSSIVLNMTNSIGQSVWNKNYGELSSGNHEFKVDTRQLAPGIYQLRVTTNEGTITKKLSVIK